MSKIEIIGEAQVSTILSTLPKKEYRVLNNIMLPTVYGTTQIDHIVVSVYGIFVIETKNYKGWITGGVNSEQWTKNVYGNKYLFRNPLKQNYAHIKALQEIIDVPEDMYISIVAFSSKATIKVKTYEHVIYYSELKRTIKLYNQVVLEQSRLDTLVSLIINDNINSKENRKYHIRNIRQSVDWQNQMIDVGICPKCGGELLVRSGRYGNFFGCSNYPQCRYTKNL